MQEFFNGWMTIPLLAAVVLILLLLWLFSGKEAKLLPPGLKPSSKENGNLSDVDKAGSLHEFLVDLHKKFGPIASFWWGQDYVVSIASPELFKEHQYVFDRPPKLFALFEPSITKYSIQYANGEDGKSRRFDFDKTFSHENLVIYYDKFQKVAEDIVKKLEQAGPDDHLPLGQYMFLFAVKAALVGLLGDSFHDDVEALAFKDSYDMAWEEMNRRLVDPNLPSDDDARSKSFLKALNSMHEIIQRAVKRRLAYGQESKDFILLDAIINHHDDKNNQNADAITYTIGGFHTTGNLLTWTVYFLAANKHFQELLYQELVSVLGLDGDVSHHNISNLKYLRQILDEGLRCGVVAPWAARFEDVDRTLGGYFIPKGTPVIHALGVVLTDEKIWPEPHKFNPDRFSENEIKSRPSLAFSPYGFAGKRICPGYRFAYVEATIMLAAIIRNFEVTLVPGQTVLPKHGLVTHPKEEIWINVMKRK